MDEDLRSFLQGMEERLDQKLAGVDQKLAGVDQKLAGVDQKLAGFDQKFAGVDQKFLSLDQMLVGMEQRFDQKLLDLEQRTDGKFLTLEQHLIEKMRDMQTELLRGFESFSNAHGIRLRKLEADQSNLDHAMTGRMAILEARLLQIEFRLGLSMLDPDPPKQ